MEALRRIKPWRQKYTLVGVLAEKAKVLSLLADKIVGGHMLTLQELKDLLIYNEQLTVLEMRSKRFDSTQRLFELQLHRSIIKDTIIELLIENFIPGVFHYE